MRDSVVLYINGNKKLVRGKSVFSSLSTYLREELYLTGTKIVCSEGDCGACTVLRAYPYPNKSYAYNRRKEFYFETINSCIAPVALMDGCHIVTIEGLKKGEELSPVQKAMVDHHGSQCGFCTPGFVMALTSLYEDKTMPVTEKQVKNYYLTGNLCRCTGYKGIIDSALSVDGNLVKEMMKDYHHPDIEKDLREHLAEDVLIKHERKTFYAPKNIDAALKFKNDEKNKQVRIFSSATDLGVLLNKGKLDEDDLCMLSLNGIEDMHEITEDPKKGIIILGARVTLTQLEKFAEDKIPAFSDLLKIFASPQIKNAGTIIGNVANASPIGDSLPFLCAVEATVELMGPKGSRLSKMPSFFQGYKKLDMQADEIIVRLHIPLLKADELLKIYKVSKRKDLDISTVSAAFILKRENKKIKSVKMALGGVAAIPLRLTEIEKFMTGKDWSLKTILEAAAMMNKVIHPLSDVRGSSEYRLELCENLLQKWFYEVEGESK